MSFIKVLENAVERVQGAVCAMILGTDGMPVEHHMTEELISLEDLSAESSQLLQDITMAAETLKLGRTREFMLVSDLCAIIMRQITPEYYLCLIVKPGGNFGKGRFVLRTIAPTIESEFL